MYTVTTEAQGPLVIMKMDPRDPYIENLPRGPFFPLWDSF